jgi:hypothetical protein
VSKLLESLCFRVIVGGPGHCEKVDFDVGSHIFYSTPSSSDTASRRANGRSRQRTGRIRCHCLYLPLGHVQYV